MPFPELPAASGVLPVLASEHSSLGNDGSSFGGLPAASPSPFMATALMPDPPTSPPPSRLQIADELTPTAMYPDFPPPKK